MTRIQRQKEAKVILRTCPSQFSEGAQCVSTRGRMGPRLDSESLPETKPRHGPYARLCAWRCVLHFQHLEFSGTKRKTPSADRRPCKQEYFPGIFRAYFQRRTLPQQDLANSGFGFV